MSLAKNSALPPEIFKAYDIRGVVGVNLTADIVETIGRAIGTEAQNRGRRQVVIGRDGRLSGPELSAALARGLTSSGVDVIDIGPAATPMLYFAAHHFKTLSGVMLTGSHNPPQYNGLKIMLDGVTLAGPAIAALRELAVQNALASGAGAYEQHDISTTYTERIVSDVKLSRPMKIAIDCGNGIAGATAPQLYRELGCKVTELFCEVDGSFPNHHPDPSVPANLADLLEAMRTTDAEIGLAFDGDGDRLGVVTKRGEIVYPDRQLMLFSGDMLARNPGATVIYDVKSTRNLKPWIERHGGKPLLWKTGHSFIKGKMAETGALLAGEMSGHIFFKERWYGFDDGLYAGARLLEILSASSDPTAAIAALPDSVSTPELQIALREGENYELMDTLARVARFDRPREVITVDGLRVEYDDGFGLARASNTTPVLVLRFEADDPRALQRIQEDFRRVLLSVKPDAVLPF